MHKLLSISKPDFVTAPVHFLQSLLLRNILKWNKIGNILAYKTCQYVMSLRTVCEHVSY